MSDAEIAILAKRWHQVRLMIRQFSASENLLGYLAIIGASFYLFTMPYQVLLPCYVGMSCRLEI